MLHRLRFTLSFALLLGILPISGCMTPASQASDASRPVEAAQAAGTLIEAATTAMQPFMQRNEWEGFRNLTAGAQGILIVPSAVRIGLVLGAQLGDGILLTRHGNLWSDPVFVKLSNYNLGFLAGASDSTLVMMLLSQGAVRQFVAGASRFSGSGGFSIGEWGVGGLGAGGISGGAQAITVETSQGLFAGGGFGSARLSLDMPLNSAVYGAGFDAMGVLSGPGGRVPGVLPLQAALSNAVRCGFSGCR
ncbi:lipid-binding SYLF domain-containing protein [Roseomonas aerophila]|uniref:Lipid-binding SYLF domain-containing protein n=1 Tax=Teichococcus aerophilus TaxID=1224513 RepID=A0ABR7RLI9_9PROT|nr:lipid-binding SYLF domain-containing protein [Pseudoroseomonas aerophila]MBC9207456.1 lipid-binding SYLF domain-containing protein [Pseudoroseomonas aerophila]